MPRENKSVPDSLQKGYLPESSDDWRWGPQTAGAVREYLQFEGIETLQTLEAAGYDIGGSINSIDPSGRTYGDLGVEALVAYARNEIAHPGSNREMTEFLRGITPVEGTTGFMTSVTRGDRTIRYEWTAAATNEAANVGVERLAAVRRANVEAYRAVVNASFATEGLTGVGFTSAWRPESPNYSVVHPGGRGLDIGYVTVDGRTQPVVYSAANRLDNVYGPKTSATSIYNTGVLGQVSGRPGSNEPIMLQQFADNLAAQERVTQVLEPWRMMGNQSAGFVASEVLDVTGMSGYVQSGSFGQQPMNVRNQITSNRNVIVHRDHLHTTVRPYYEGRLW